MEATTADSNDVPALDERYILHLLSDFIGPAYGTEDFSQFLYSIVRLQAPRTIVELGTGFGTSAFWMALAAKRNGFGRVWTVDDLEVYQRHPNLVAETVKRLHEIGLQSFSASTGLEYLQAVSSTLGLDDHLHVLRRSIALEEPSHFDDYPFAGDPIDLLFSDFRHGAKEVLALLGHFLPRMSPASSIFIDSAPTAWPSYLLLEKLVATLNEGRVPLALQERSTSVLDPIVRNRRFILVHLTEAKDRSQNSTAWIKLEPIDVLPQPRATMRGFV